MNQENEPFSDVIDHFNKIEGNGTHPSNTKVTKLPKPFRLIGYFMIGFLSISLLLAIILNFL